MSFVIDGSTAKTKDNADRRLRVLVVDDHEVQRVGTRQVLETAEDIVVVAEAGGGNDAVALVGEVNPDIALLDIRLPDRNGVDVARELAVHHRGTRVVILSAYDDDSSVRGALEAGVVGYLLKTMPREQLISAVRAAGQGDTVVDPAGVGALGVREPLSERCHFRPPHTTRAADRRSCRRGDVKQGDRGPSRCQRTNR